MTKDNISEQNTLRKCDTCEKCGGKDFNYFSSGGYNFKICKKCGEGYLDEQKTHHGTVCNQCDDYPSADKKMKCSKSPYQDGLCHG